MKTIKYLLGTALLLVFTASTTFALNIDKVTDRPVFSKTQFGYKDIYKNVITSYQSSLDLENSTLTSFYGRYVSGKLITEDKQRIAQCKGNASCMNEFLLNAKFRYERSRDNKIFFSKAIQVFKDKLGVLNGTNKEFDYIETKYGKDVYNFIIDNKDNLNASFKTYIENERNLISNGKYYTKMSGNGGDMVVQSYERYVYYIGFKKLEENRRKARTPLLKAKYEYFEYLLLSDERLYITN